MIYASTRPRYQVSVYRTIGPLASFSLEKMFHLPFELASSYCVYTGIVYKNIIMLMFFYLLCSIFPSLTYYALKNSVTYFSGIT